MQALYWHHSQPWDDLAQIVNQIGKDRRLAQKGIKHAFLLARAVEDHQAEYRDDLARVSQNWDADRIGRVEEFIVSLALAEWDMADNEAPPKVVLNEAVTLAGEFCGEESGRFVNGVLDTLGHERGVLGNGSAGYRDSKR